MKLETWQRDRNERCMERHQLSIERLQMIDQEETVQDRYRPYFRMCAAFLLKLESLRRTIEDHSFETFTLEERKRWNQELKEPGIVFYHYNTYLNYLMEQL